MPLEMDDAALVAGSALFTVLCHFVAGGTSLESIPHSTLPEVAFAGRSNVGKSSLVNALTGRTALARASNTPGRTRELNFFNLADRLMLVDMPGYGYAKAPKTAIAEWTRLVRDYLRGRRQLRRVLLLIDARHGIMKNDETIMQLLNEAAVPYRVVLTKADKLSHDALRAVIEATELRLKRHPAAMPLLCTTSSQSRTGIDVLRADIASLALNGAGS